MTVGSPPPEGCTCTTYYSGRLGKDVIGAISDSCPVHGKTQDDD